MSSNNNTNRSSTNGNGNGRVNPGSTTNNTSGHNNAGNNTTNSHSNGPTLNTNAMAYNNYNNRDKSNPRRPQQQGGRGHGPTPGNRNNQGGRSSASTPGSNASRTNAPPCTPHNAQAQEQQTPMQRYQLPKTTKRPQHVTPLQGTKQPRGNVNTFTTGTTTRPMTMHEKPNVHLFPDDHMKPTPPPLTLYQETELAEAIAIEAQRDFIKKKQISDAVEMATSTVMEEQAIKEAAERTTTVESFEDSEYSTENFDCLTPPQETGPTLPPPPTGADKPPHLPHLPEQASQLPQTLKPHRRWTQLTLTPF